MLISILGEARGRIEREIELARELYQTLVANVVTGQFDVSHVVVELDEEDVELPDFGGNGDEAEVEIDEE